MRQRLVVENSPLAIRRTTCRRSTSTKTVDDMDAVFRRVLVPVDFLPADEDDGDHVDAAGQRVRVGKAVQQSLELGASLARSGTICLLHAAPSLLFSAVYGGGPEGAWVPTEAMRKLDQQVELSSLTILRELGRRFCPNARLEFAAQAGTPVTVILSEAERFEADLIVLATSGHGRAKRFFLGSTADKVIRQATCPVLVVPSEIDE